jgi:hypothetical protein
MLYSQIQLFLSRGAVHAMMNTEYIINICQYISGRKSMRWDLSEQGMLMNLFHNKIAPYFISIIWWPPEAVTSVSEVLEVLL